ncbi:hypothetical protein ACFOOM_07650 [Streptomyces echinoruber]|uniref:Uncharacterized protein n=1 Tax=Streptomyces echinoruber TaxID=68898 RepID=A0A918V8M4_9ACTN|nr:hypothetical protein [Streptomyces echinoruber]GGZ80319.1 hypothetical protein GCM10010389_17680 [Streptomyces echinoruber]
MSTCTICPRTAPDGQHACPLHADELRAWLAELPRQAALLEQFVVPAGRPAAGRLGGTGRAHAPVPVDLRVLALLGPGHAHAPAGSPYEEAAGTIPLRAWLDGWAGYIAYTYPAVTRDPYGTAHVQPCEAARPRRGATIAGWCAWLTAYLPYVLAHPWVSDLHRQLGDLLTHLRDLTHAVPHRHHQAAPCPKCQSFALVTVDGQWGITCEACGHHLERTAYDDHAARFLRTLRNNA